MQQELAGGLHLKKLSRQYTLSQLVYVERRAFVTGQEAVLSLSTGCADCDGINQPPCHLCQQLMDVSLVTWSNVAGSSQKRSQQIATDLSAVTLVVGNSQAVM